MHKAEHVWTFLSATVPSRSEDKIVFTSLVPVNVSQHYLCVASITLVQTEYRGSHPHHCPCCKYLSLTTYESSASEARSSSQCLQKQLHKQPVLTLFRCFCMPCQPVLLPQDVESQCNLYCWYSVMVLQLFCSNVQTAVG